MCFAVSNCLASEADVLGKVLEHPIFEHKIWKSPNQEYRVFISLISSPSSYIYLLFLLIFQVNKEVCYCFINALSFGSYKQILELFQRGLIDIFCEMSAVSESHLVLAMMSAVVRTMNLAQETPNDKELFQMILHGPIPNWLVSLQSHPDLKIYQKAYDMVFSFLDCEPDTE